MAAGMSKREATTRAATPPNTTTAASITYGSRRYDEVKAQRRCTSLLCTGIRVIKAVGVRVLLQAVHARCPAQVLQAFLVYLQHCDRVFRVVLRTVEINLVMFLEEVRPQTHPRYSPCILHRSNGVQCLVHGALKSVRTRDKIRQASFGVRLAHGHRWVCCDSAISLFYVSFLECYAESRGAFFACSIEKIYFIF